MLLVVRLQGAACAFGVGSHSVFVQAEQLAGSLLNEDDGDDTEKYTVGEAIDHIGASRVAAGVVSHGANALEPERGCWVYLASVAGTRAYPPLHVVLMRMRLDTCRHSQTCIKGVTPHRDRVMVVICSLH